MSAPCAKCVAGVLPDDTACADCGKGQSLISRTATGRFSLKRNWLGLTFLLVVMALFALLAVNGWGTIRLMQANNNLKNIGKALYQYHEAHGTFPPAFVFDDKGNRLHSWRTLIVPFLAGDNDPGNYRLSERWDSPHNLAAGRLHGASDYEYSFLAVVGNDAAWPRRGSRTFKEFTDGTSNSILVIAIKNPGVGWYEPVDLEFDGQRLWLSHNGKRQEVSTKPCFVLTADGAVRYLRGGIAEHTLKSLITINDGGEVGKW